MPRNCGNAAWAYLASFGGGLVDGDRFAIGVDVGQDASMLLGTQASTKVYRSPNGCAQKLAIRAAEGSLVAVVPEPVVCFAGARYKQEIHATLAPSGSLLVLDGYTCGRSARGERWQFDHFEAKTTIVRDDRVAVVEAIHLDPAHGPIAERMSRFDVFLTLIAIGPRFGQIREAMLASRAAPRATDSAISAVSPIGDDAAILRIAADRFEYASSILRPSFEALARILGDDPFARKW